MQNRARIAIILWAVSVVFSVRYVLGPVQSFGAEQYLEYITPYISLATLAHCAVIALLWPRVKRYLTPTSLALTLLFASIGLLGASNWILGAWWTSIIILWFWAAASMYFSLKEENLRRFFVWTVVVLGISQATLGIIQYTLQHSIGLALLGEPNAHALTQGVAKVVVNGEKFLRPFGTFPHSNVWAGMLVVTLFALLSQKRRLFTSNPLLLQISTGVVLFALLISYSRSAWIATCFLVLWFGFKNGWRFLVIPVVSVVIALLLFGPSVQDRFTLGQQAEQFDVRSYGLVASIESFWSQPILGQGLRQFIPYMRQNYPHLIPYFYQPPHNVSFLLLAEIGIIGLLFVLIVLANVLLKISPAIVVPVVIIFIVLGAFDHYLVTLPQGLGLVGTLSLLGLFSRESQVPKRDR